MDIKAVAHLISRVLDRRTRTLKAKVIKMNKVFYLLLNKNISYIHNAWTIKFGEGPW